MLKPVRTCQKPTCHTDLNAFCGPRRHRPICGDYTDGLREISSFANIFKKGRLYVRGEGVFPGDRSPDRIEAARFALLLLGSLSHQKVGLSSPSS